MFDMPGFVMEHLTTEVPHRSIEREHNDDVQPSLLTLPLEILHRILEHLLDGKTNKIISSETVEPWFLPNYSFWTSIMRVNKKLNAMAEDVFEANHFVLVSSTTPEFHTTLMRNRVWHRREKIGKFKKHHLHTFVGQVDGPRRKDRKHYFMVLLDNIDGLVNVLRVADVGLAVSFRLIFEVKSHSNGNPLPLKTQQAMLRPFYKLQSIGQQCTIRGSVDPVLRAHGSSVMQPRLHWYRAQCWNFFDVVRFKQSVADSFFDSANAGAAIAAYLDVLDLMAGAHVFFGRAHPLEHAILTGDDEDLRLRYQNTRARTIATLCLEFVETELPLPPQLNEGMNKTILWTIMDETHDVFKPPYLTKSQATLFKLLKGFALIALGKMQAGLDLMRAAHDKSCRHFDYVEDLVLQAEEIARLQAHAQNTDVLMEELRMGVAMGMFNMPDETKISPKFPKTTTIASVDLERYVLQKMGYNGDLLEEQVKQQEGWSVTFDRGGKVLSDGPFDIKYADEVVDHLKAEVKRVQFPCWGVLSQERAGSSLGAIDMFELRSLPLDAVFAGIAVADGPVAPPGFY